MLNLNNLLRFQSVDRKRILYLGAYNGLLSLSIFDGEDQSPKKPMGKVLLNLAVIKAMEDILVSVIKEKNTNSRSVQFYRYDTDLNQYVQSGNVTIGRDEEGLIYIDITTETLKDPIRFPLRTFQFGIDQNVVSNVVNSEYVAKSMVRVLNNAIIAMMLSKDAESIKNAATARMQKNNANKSDNDVVF